MKRTSRALLCAVLPCAILLFFATQTFAQSSPDDAEGCKDSPLISRFPGGKINTCDNKEFEQADFTIGHDKDGNEISKHLEGEYHYWDIATRDGVSDLQVFRNFQTAIKNGGFIIDYTQSPQLIVAHKGNTWLQIDSRGAFYYQTIVTVQDMKQEVTGDASSLSNEIEKSGHVAVYGINFDTGKATIQPDSEKVLSQIVQLLQQSPDLKLRIEGHTDNQGTAATNQLLSEKRAQAVVAWLGSHGISASRLTAKGLGQTAPVADNATEEGRAKNRRVELVKIT
jgi:outer membrane protein OmpA-like peptidoglycan-associated protein